MSKLRALAEKELANITVEREAIIKSIEQTKQALINREQSLKEIDNNIQELESFLSPKKPVSTKGKK